MSPRTAFVALLALLSGVWACPGPTAPHPPQPHPSATASVSARAQEHRPDKCRARRAAFDIGSATTKVKVADVDTCQQRMIRLLLSDDAPAFYRDDVSGKSVGEGALREETMAKGLDVLKRFKARAAKFSPDGYVGVATSAFRRAENGAEFLERVRNEVQIAARIISQGEEAELGFVAAVASRNVDPQRAVVWDVGGQSMQLSAKRGDQLVIYLGHLASGQMRDHVLKLQNKSGQQASPNPISAEVAVAARAFGAESAKREIPALFKKRLADPNTIVVGIGALKYYGDRAPRGSTRSTLAGMEKQLAALLGKTDEQIGGAYASTQVSDRLLIVSFMKALSIDRIELADIDLSDGLLFHSDYWDSDEIDPEALP